MSNMAHKVNKYIFNQFSASPKLSKIDYDSQFILILVHILLNFVNKTWFLVVRFVNVSRWPNCSQVICTKHTKNDEIFHRLKFCFSIIKF